MQLMGLIRSRVTSKPWELLPKVPNLRKVLTLIVVYVLKIEV